MDGTLRLSNTKEGRSERGPGGSGDPKTFTVVAVVAEESLGPPEGEEA